MFKSQILVLVACAAFPAASHQARADIVIDAFDTTQSLSGGTDFDVQEGSVEDNDVFGGFRLINAHTSGPDPMLLEVNNGGSGTMQFSISGSSHASASIFYYGHAAGGGTPVVPPTDFTGNGTLDRLAIDVLSATSDISMQIYIVSEFNYHSLYFVTVPGTITTPTTIELPFSGFVPLDNPVEFTGVRGLGISTDLDGPGGVELDNFRVVPEPNVLSIMLLGAALAVRRR